MNKRTEGDRGSWDGTGCGDHDMPYQLGNPKMLLSWHEMMRLRFRVNFRDVERRRNQEHNARPLVQKAIDKAKIELERRKVA